MANPVDDPLLRPLSPVGLDEEEQPLSPQDLKENTKKVDHLIVARDLLVGSGIAGGIGFGATFLVSWPLAIGVGTGVAAVEALAYWKLKK